MHVCKLGNIFNGEELDFLHEALEAQLAEAEEVLTRHVSEEPPLFDIKTTGEAAEDYSNLVATQKRRIEVLSRALSLCDGG